MRNAFAVFILFLPIIQTISVNGQESFSYDREAWLAKAESAKPNLIETIVQPVGIVDIQKNPDAFQGWEAKPISEIDRLYDQSIKQLKSVTVDFGDHYTGTFSCELAAIQGTPDAPVRFKLTFGEVPAELATPFDPYDGALSRAWLQDEVVTVMTIPSTVTLERRVSCRYLKIELLGASQYFDFKIAGMRLTAVTSAAKKPPALSPATPDTIREIDRIGLKTLAECMQTVYEDGPKRDRRLWVGDLYLEALANAYSFENHVLTKRCLYLLAGLCDDEGYVLGTVFETPKPHAQAGQRLMDYALLYNVALKEYLAATGDRETADDLWPVARRQLAIIDQYVSDSGLVDYERANREWWLFFDWKDGLHKHAAQQGLMIFALDQTYHLAGMLDKQDEVSFIPGLIAKMRAAAKEQFYNGESGLCESGSDGQISFASQTWMILGGVLSRDESRKALDAVRRNDQAIQPGGPYMYHYCIQAMIDVGKSEEAKTSLVSFWGGMVDKGADTFWEVYDPNDDFRSPYNFFPVNSYCHAWSCTPVYFIRKYPEIFQK